LNSSAFKPPPEAEVFEFPIGLRWFMLLSSFLFGGFLIFVLAGRMEEPPSVSPSLAIASVLVFGTLGVLALRCFVRFRDSVAVNSEGIWYIRPTRESTFMAWGEVANVEAHDLQQRLVIVGATNSAKIKVEYQLDNFSQLRDLILKYTAAVRLSRPRPSVFHRNWVNRGTESAFIAMFLVFAALSFHQGQTGPSILFAGFACLGLFVLTREPIELAIVGAAIVIKYLGRERTIPFEGVSGIVLTNVHFRGNEKATVVIESPESKPVNLMGFREGSVVLYEALYSAWCSARGGARVANAS
jgi:hypothetical protein